ncbi:S24 family peptidase [Lichenicoccus sp.]|uniref:S24 family peptidase n=1 Tax=Lichenicoccus sp. TaxID=2781899 RepID=UPI003D0FDF35
MSASQGQARNGAAKPSALPTGCTERLRAAVQRAGGTKHVAIRSGVALSTLGSYLAGGEMKLATAMQLCAACNVSLAWLVGEMQAYPAQATSWHAPGKPDGLVRVRRLASSDEVVHQFDGVLFDAAWLRAQRDCEPRHLAAFEAQSGAMEPAVARGDLLLIDTEDTDIQSLALHLVDADGELIIRRLERTLDGGVLVRTDRPRDPPQVIARGARETLRVVGRVVWRGTKIV